MRAVLLGCALAAACAGAAEPGALRSPIVGGTPTTGDPAVVLLIAQVPGSKLATLCSASLVAPRVLLTAAHCLIPQVVGDGAVFQVLPGPNIDVARQSDLLPVQGVHAHPDFDQASVAGGNDIGVVVLPSPLGTPPIPMHRDALSNDLVGRPARLVGYGQTMANDPTGASAGQRREVTTVMGGYTDRLVRFGTAGQSTCEGDSGGPGLMTFDGEERIVGVVSYGDIDCAQFGVDTRVDRYADDWVQPFVDDPDGDGTKKGGGCSVPCTRDVTVPWLLVAIAVALVGNRRPATGNRRPATSEDRI